MEILRNETHHHGVVDSVTLGDLEMKLEMEVAARQKALEKREREKHVFNLFLVTIIP